MYVLGGNCGKMGEETVQTALPSMFPSVASKGCNRAKAMSVKKRK